MSEFKQKFIDFLSENNFNINEIKNELLSLFNENIEDSPTRNLFSCRILSIDEYDKYILNSTLNGSINKYDSNVWNDFLKTNVNGFVCCHRPIGESISTWNSGIKQNKFVCYSNTNIKKLPEYTNFNNYEVRGCSPNVKDNVYVYTNLSQDDSNNKCKYATQRKTYESFQSDWVDFEKWSYMIIEISSKELIDKQQTKKTTVVVNAPIVCSNGATHTLTCNNYLCFRPVFNYVDNNKSENIIF